jgi:Leucine-rich repeat (LRR) protein
LGKLPSLILLNAAENNLEKVPAELGSLSSLSKLYLDNNDLLDLNPALGNLVTLKGIITEKEEDE